MNKYIWAAGACIGLFCLYVFLGLAVFGWSSTSSPFGGVFPQLLLLAAMAAAWRAITKKKAPAVKTQPSANSVALPVKETKLPIHEPMLTSQTIEESPEPAVGSSNTCPACGAENSPDVKFCESCGREFYRACPECGRENSVKKQYCGGCGTDMAGFIAAQAILNRMEACKEEKNLLQIIEVNKGLKGDVRLPGRKGKKLRAGIEELARKADNILKQIERLEKEIELRCPVGEKPSISDDRKLLKRLDEHYWIQPYFSEKLRVLEKKTKARVSEAARIVRRRNFKIIAGFVVLVALGLNRDILLFGIRKSAFQKAVETRQEDAAQSVANKLGGWYDTADGLKALEEYGAAKHQFNEEAIADGGLFEKFASLEWVAIQDLVKKAEEPGDPRAGVVLYEQARIKLHAVPPQLVEMIAAKQSCENVFTNIQPATKGHLQKYAPQEWLAVQQSLKDAEVAATADAAVAIYRQAEAVLRSAIEKIKTIPATVMIECNAPGFEVFENNQRQPTNNGQLTFSPFVEHTLEIRASGYVVKTLTVMAEEPGQRLKINPVILARQITSDLVEVPEATYAPLNGLAAGSTQAQTAQQAEVKQSRLPLEVKSRVTGIAFRLVPAGSFTMGNPSASYSSGDEQHPVTLSQPFYCGKFEITQRQWKQVSGSNPSYFINDGDAVPVERVSWEDCQVFLEELCKLEGVPKGTYRLLTEAEWEYACRAGTTGSYAQDVTSNYSGPDEMGWIKGEKSPYPVGQKKANAWGLYDMHGNVSEWCGDWNGDYPKERVINPSGAPSGQWRGCRGGSYEYGSDRSAGKRYFYMPTTLRDNIGFRIMRVVPQVG